VRGYDPYAQYKKTKVETSSPAELITLLYDEAVKSSKLAIKAIEDKKPEMAHGNILKVQDILDELCFSIDKEKGGEIAENLLSLYDYMKHKLVEANIKKDSSLVSEVCQMIEELRTTWQEATKAGIKGNG